MRVILLISILLTVVNSLKLDRDNDTEEESSFCALTNSKTGSYIDLSELTPTPNRLRDHNDAGDKKNGLKGTSPKTRWLVRGWDYDNPTTYTNFTLSICSSAVSSKQEEDQTFPLNDLTGGYFFDNSTQEYVSIGDFSTKPVFLGDITVNNRKLSLRYENGSVCPNGRDRRSTIINFVCNREIQTNAQIQFLGSLHDCSYIFEVQSLYACPTSTEKNDVNVLGIFFGIFFVFFLVEIVRRQVYKMLNEGTSSRNTNNLENNNHSRFSNYGRDEYQARWEVIESEPKWKMVIKLIVNKASKLPVYVFNKISRDSIGSRYYNNSASYSRVANTRTADEGAIHLNSSNRSQDSFVRDMEIQNNILDNLDHYNSNSTSPSTFTSNPNDISVSPNESLQEHT